MLQKEALGECERETLNIPYIRTQYAKTDKKEYNVLHHVLTSPTAARSAHGMINARFGCNALYPSTLSFS